MEYSNPLFTIPIITGPLLLVIMLIVHKYPPKKINTLYGYRTKQSMSDQKKWDFAQVYSTKLMMKYSILYTLTAVFGIIFSEINLYIQLVLAIVIMIVFMFIPIMITEKKLKSLN